MLDLLALVVLPALAGIALVDAQDTSDSSVTVVDFYSQVVFQPPTAWRTTLSNPCQTTDHYTATTGANLTLTFVGML